MDYSLGFGRLKSFQVGSRTEVHSAKNMLCKGLSQPVFAVAFKLVYAQSAPETSESAEKSRQ